MLAGGVRRTVRNQLTRLTGGGTRAADTSAIGIADEPIPGYRVLRRLGKGGSGEVWEVEAPGGLAKAIKLARIDHTLAQRELEGLQTIRRIRHPFLLVIERFELLEGKLIVVTELADMSTADRFEEYVGRGMPGIPRMELLGYIKEAAEVLDTMSQKHGILHLDVKPTNLLLLGGHVKVADFGLVQPKDAFIGAENLAFTPAYSAPEMFEGRVTPTSDQYSLAVTFQELLTGSRPYRATQVVALAAEQQENPPDVSTLPDKDRLIVLRALDRDPSRRFRCCRDFVDALYDPDAYFRTLSPAELHPEPQMEPRVSAAADATRTAIRRFHVRTSQLAGPTERVEKKPAPPAEPARPTAQRGTPADLTTGDVLRASFLASIPKELFVLKLRGFVQALRAQVNAFTDRSIDLTIHARRWIGLWSGNSYHMTIEILRRADQEAAAVDVTIVSSSDAKSGEEFQERANLLLCSLKSYLMATGGNESYAYSPTNVLKQL
jgi:serine/threonine protein kinase